jgi:hypothetical protein
LRANAAGTERSRQVRPQADSCSGRTMRARSHSIAPRRSSLASEHGGHRNHRNRFVRKRTPTAGGQCVHEAIPLPPVGARLRANAAGTERSRQVRPQADSYSGRTMRARRRSIAPCRSSLASEHGGHRNHRNRFVRKRTPTAGAQRVHEAIPLPPVGARLRANAAGTERSRQIRPQADSYSGRTTRARRRSIAPCRSSLASEGGGHRTIATGSSASGLLQRANNACTKAFHCPL